MKIYAYGDSYIASGWNHYQGPDLPILEFDGWTQILAKNLKVELHNRGVSGGSTENAMLQFTDDVRNSEFDSGDVILFQASTAGRLHFLFQKERPETASVYLHDVDVNDPRHVWYRENKQYIKWYIQNYDNRLNILNHTCYLHTLINFARSRPDLTVVLLSNSEHEPAVSLPNLPDNCLSVDTYLNTISRNEWISCDYNSWVKFTKYDIRINHLSLRNLNTLAKLLEESLATRRTDNFSYDCFDKQIFTPVRSKDDYYGYVARGLIYNQPEFFNR
jgi:hypothetical protein